MNIIKKLCLLLFVSVTSCLAATVGNYKVVCYLGSWANYRNGDGAFLIEHIDPFLCTHAIYGFAKLENNEIAVYDTYLDVKENYGLGAFDRFNNLKKINPNLKTLIAIGGWNEGSKKYSAMASDASSRATFVKSAVEFCKKYGFDGLDMDWEYPANRGGVPEDKENFVALLKELKEAFTPHGLLLTAAVSAGKKTIDTAYDIPGVAKYLDFINVMAYDLHGSWEQKTGHNAPLYARDEEPDDEKVLNVDYAITYWNQQGAPKDKIILGMGLYGRSFTLADSKNNGLDALSYQPGSAGQMTQEPGMLGYNEICLNLKKGWTEVFVEDRIRAPYAYKGNQWVGYDNKKSIGTKVDYIMEKGLGGGMVWSLETDDFRGKCGEGKYPLLSTIASKLNGEGQRGTLLPDTRTTTAPVERSTTSVGKPFQCPSGGYFKDPFDCSKFYFCIVQGENEIARHTYDCGEGLAFDVSKETCTYRDQVAGC